MGRAIRPGDVVLVRAGGEPRRGEIWAFCKASGGIVVHRFRRRIHGWYNFQGDAVWRSDDPVRRDQVVGRIVAVERGGSRRRIGSADLLKGRLALDVGTIAARIRRLRPTRHNSVTSRD
jgi:hypothetical protein